MAALKPRTTPDKVALPMTNAQKRANCATLADYLEGVPDPQVYMGTWVLRVRTEGSEPECGTTACAAGWAALSGLIPGLGWQDRRGELRGVSPVVNGVATTFHVVVEHFFPARAKGVFFSDAPREAVIAKLRACSTPTTRK